jgi:hypothetical protein
VAIPTVLSATVIASLKHNAYSDSLSGLAVVLPNLVEDHLLVAVLLDIVATHVHLPQIAPLHLADSCRVFGQHLFLKNVSGMGKLRGSNIL